MLVSQVQLPSVDNLAILVYLVGTQSSMEHVHGSLTLQISGKLRAKVTKRPSVGVLLILLLIINALEDHCARYLHSLLYRLAYDSFY